MVEPCFSEEELALFVSRFRATQAWHSWRRGTEGGRDVIEITRAADPGRPIRLARLEHDRYGVTGFDGWGLIVSEDFAALLEMLIEAGNRRTAAAGSWPVETAA